MLLQSTVQQSPLHHQPHNHASLSYSLSFPSGFGNSSFLPAITSRKHPVVTCSISQVYSYGTLDYERKPGVKWNAIYKRISLMENPEKGAASILNQCENEGKTLTKWELCRVVKELRKFRRFKLALEVYIYVPFVYVFIWCSFCLLVDGYCIIHMVKSYLVFFCVLVAGYWIIHKFKCFVGVLV